MRKTLQVLNELVREKVLENYAIGGAIAALFYAEAFYTEDLDIFAALKSSPSGLITLHDLYEVLRARGYVEEHGHMIIEGVPVQFLPLHTPLVVEALQNARIMEYEGVPVSVFTPEHLMAIMLQTGRAKDRERLRTFKEQAQWNESLLDEVLTRHGLRAQWQLWTAIG